MYILNMFHKELPRKLTWYLLFKFLFKNHVGPTRSWSYGNWIYIYLCNQFLSPLKSWVEISLRRGVLDTTLCNKVCQWLAVGQWFSLGTPISSNKTDHHDIAEILLKMALNTINQPINRIPLRRGILDTTLYDKVCQWLVAGQRFHSGTPVSSTNKTDNHDI